MRMTPPLRTSLFCKKFIYTNHLEIDDRYVLSLFFYNEKSQFIKNFIDCLH